MSQDALRQEHESLQRAVQLSRRQFTVAPESAFVRAMLDAMDDYARVRKEGVSREDGVRGIEQVLRATWPKPPSKFSAGCEGCEDTGWRELTCWSEHRCGRQSCVEGHPSREHRYVEPCGCEKGDRFRPRVHVADDEIAAVGRTRKAKPRGFTRFGR